jgi:hypothetical protein
MTIKIKTEKVPYYEGLALYVNGRKVHIGVFVGLKALREFWSKYRVLLCAGYSFENGKCEKIN